MVGDSSKSAPGLSLWYQWLSMCSPHRYSCIASITRSSCPILSQVCRDWQWGAALLFIFRTPLLRAPDRISLRHRRLYQSWTVLPNFYSWQIRVPMAGFRHCLKGPIPWHSWVSAIHFKIIQVGMNSLPPDFIATSNINAPTLSPNPTAWDVHVYQTPSIGGNFVCWPSFLTTLPSLVRSKYILLWRL